MHRESSDEIAELAARMMNPHAVDELVTDEIVRSVIANLAEANGFKQAKNGLIIGLAPLLSQVRRVAASVVSQADGPEPRA